MDGVDQPLLAGESELKREALFGITRTTTGIRRISPLASFARATETDAGV